MSLTCLLSPWCNFNKKGSKFILWVMPLTVVQVLKYLLENLAEGISACGPGTISIIKYSFI